MDGNKLTSPYQSFALIRHLDRGETDAARIVASLPPHGSYSPSREAASLAGDYGDRTHEQTEQTERNPKPDQQGGERVMGAKGEMNSTQEPAVTLANDALVKAGFDPVFTVDAQLSDHKQYGGEFEGQTLRKVFQPGPLPHMAMILLGAAPRVVVLKRGAQDLM